jgi:hypothetical protein
MQPVARIGPADSKELAHMIESLSAEGPVERMVGRIELDGDPFVLGQVGGAASPDHPAEFGPGLAGSLLEIGKGNGRAVDAQQAASAQHELDQVLPQHGIGEQVSDRVVQAHGVELIEVFASEDRRISRDDGVKAPVFSPMRAKA